MSAKQSNSRAERELLPWYLTDQLDALSRQRLDDALSQSATLKAELHWLRELRRHLKREKHEFDQDGSLNRLTTLVNREKGTR